MNPPQHTQKEGNITQNPDEFRPTDWESFVGQHALKERLAVQIEAARKELRPLAHVFLAGPPGFGKTTLAHLIAERLHDPLTSLQMPITAKTLVRAVREFEGGILFLDELHALGKAQQEMLLPLLSSGTLHDTNGREYTIEWLTVIAATTERDKVIAPLHSRFPIAPDFEPYTDGEMTQIVRNMARNTLRLNPKTAEALGRAAGGIPRAAHALVAGARDLAATGRPADPESVLRLCGVDPDGLTGLHTRYLQILHSQGNVAGQRTVEMMLRVPPSVIRDVERLLLERGYIEYTPTGRELTPAGSRKLQGGEKEPYRRAV